MFIIEIIKKISKLYFKLLISLKTLEWDLSIFSIRIQAFWNYIFIDEPVQIELEYVIKIFSYNVYVCAFPFHACAFLHQWEKRIIKHNW